jgi:peptide chain release factor 1
MIPSDKIDQILQRFEFLEASMAGGLDAADYVSISKEYAALEPAPTGH